MYYAHKSGKPLRRYSIHLCCSLYRIALFIEFKKQSITRQMKFFFPFRQISEYLKNWNVWICSVISQICPLSEGLWALIPNLKWTYPKWTYPKWTYTKLTNPKWIYHYRSSMIIVLCTCKLFQFTSWMCDKGKLNISVKMSEIS